MDLTPLAGLLGLSSLHLENNQVSDLTPLVTNSNKHGLGSGDWVYLEGNPLDLTAGSDAMVAILTLVENGIEVRY